MTACRFSCGGWIVVAGLALAGWPASPVLAQRYLTEFVGTSRVTAGARLVTLPSALNFELEDNRRVGGQFSYIEQDNLGGFEIESLSATATLAANGNCLVKLTDTTNAGALRLRETSFDENTFSLIGTIAVDRDGGQVVLDPQGFQGAAGFLRPLADAVPVRIGVREARLVSALDGSATLAAWNIEDRGLHLTATGHFGDLRNPQAYDLVATVSDTWIYGTGVGSTSFLTLRAKAQRNSQNVIIGYEGEYEVGTIDGKMIDAGTITIAAD
jgi:hypothetical protein